MKPRIAILYSGQMRSNPLNDRYKNDDLVLQTSSTYFFNDEFKQKYDYDVFIATDTIDVMKAIEYFGEDHLQNIHIREQNFFLSPLTSRLCPFSEYRTSYESYPDYKDYERRYVLDGTKLFQMYRIREAYHMLECHMQATHTSYDLIVRTRPDVIFKQSVVPLFDELLANPAHQATAISDIFNVGKSAIMHEYLTSLDHNYMRYRSTGPHTFTRFVYDHDYYYAHVNDVYYLFSPEMQLSECFFSYCEKQGFRIADALKGYDPGEYVGIYNRHVFCG